MHRYAQQITSRAIQRAGQLLEEMQPQRGGDRKSKVRPSTPLKTQKASAAEEAKMSKHQQVQAIRVARVPEPEFERQMQAPKPPTLTVLGSKGKGPGSTVYVPVSAGAGTIKNFPDTGSRPLSCTFVNPRIDRHSAVGSRCP